VVASPGREMDRPAPRMAGDKGMAEAWWWERGWQDNNRGMTTICSLPWPGVGDQHDGGITMGARPRPPSSGETEGDKGEEGRCR
jgi:hypothetical protein